MMIPAPASCTWTLSGAPGWIGGAGASGSGPESVALTELSAAAPERRAARGRAADPD